MDWLTTTAQSIGSAAVGGISKGGDLILDRDRTALRVGVVDDLGHHLPFLKRVDETGAALALRQHAFELSYIFTVQLAGQVLVEQFVAHGRIPCCSRRLLRQLRSLSRRRDSIRRIALTLRP